MKYNKATKKIVLALVVLTLTTVVLRFLVVPYIDASKNQVMNKPPFEASKSAKKIHENMFVADLHADSLLFRRDLKNKSNRGHVDLPRLKEGGIDLQVFGVVTKVPKNLSYKENKSDSDKLPLLFFASWRNPTTWFEPKARALTQAKEWRKLGEESELTLIFNKADLSKPGLKGLLGLEGIHALEGDAEESLNEFYQAGFRMLGLTHFFDNRFAGSAHGTEKHGLTQLGKRLIPKMEKLGITIDLAHSSVKTYNEVLGMATKPIVVSHGGVKGTCKGPRNISDSMLKKIAKNGGVVGIGYWETATCDTSIAGIIRAIKYAVKVAGIDHVGLGSDFDGTILPPFDTTGVPMITEQLIKEGFTQKEVAKIMGENVKRVLETNLLNHRD